MFKMKCDKCGTDKIYYTINVPRAGKNSMRFCSICFNELQEWIKNTKTIEIKE